MVTVFLYLAGGILVGLRRRAPTISFVLLGVVLGLGYWSKAIMFPAAFVFLGVSVLKAPKWKGNLASVVVFFVVAAPLLAALSLPRGRFTFGDSGKIAYSCLVSPGGRVINWQGVPAASGVPKHPTRVISGVPPVYEFNGPLPGTYPPSYDPSYWNEGRKATFNLRSQISIVIESIPRMVEMLFVSQLSLTAGFLFLLLWNPERYLSFLLRRWDLLLISVVMTGLYMLVLFETRYAGAFAVFAWLAAFLAVRVPADGASRRVAGLSIVALVAGMLLSFASNTAKTIANGCPESARQHVQMAQQLNLSPGTPVAVVGLGNFSYWAHLARVRIVADVMAQDESAFWKLPPAGRQQIYTAFGSAGGRWLIAQPPAAYIDSLEEGWKRIGTTPYYEYRLQESKRGGN